MHVNLLILVMCSSSRKFKKLERSIKQTWASTAYPGVEIIFYRDNQRRLIRQNTPVLKGRDLILPCKDGYLNCTEKTLQAFEYISHNCHFDYIFRTNLGSYVYQDRIIDFLSGKPKIGFYAGIQGTYKENQDFIKFASGSGYFLSEDLVRLIVLKRHNVNRQIIDDVALGEFMAAEGVIIDDRASRLSYTTQGSECQIGDKMVSFLDDSQVYHIRLRSDDRDIDIQRMHALFNNKEF